MSYRASLHSSWSLLGREEKSCRRTKPEKAWSPVLVSPAAGWSFVHLNAGPKQGVGTNTVVQRLFRVDLQLKREAVKAQPPPPRALPRTTAFPCVTMPAWLWDHFLVGRQPSFSSPSPLPAAAPPAPSSPGVFDGRASAASRIICMKMSKSAVAVMIFANTAS